MDRVYLLHIDAVKRLPGGSFQKEGFPALQFVDVPLPPGEFQQNHLIGVKWAEILV
jgi:hypothetical protein